MRIVILSLLLAQPALAADTFAERLSSLYNRPGGLTSDQAATRADKTSYEMRMFKLRDGSLFELAWCDPRKRTTWSRYMCWAVNLGRQDGRWVEGELVTFGAQYRPGRGPVTIVAGGGAGLVTVMVDGVICMARKPGPGRFQNHNPPSRKCNGSLFPFELAAELGVRTAIPAGRIGIEVQVIARYHANINGDGTDWIGRVPAGPMVSAGAGLIF